MDKGTQSVLWAFALVLGCSSRPDEAKPVPPVAAGGTAATAATATVPSVQPATLFDGTSLENWKVLGDESFPGRGGVRVEDGALVMEQGDPFTGVAWTGPFATVGYEIELEARRVAGSDIFCGVTVPVGDEHVTLVLGGWGNCLIGLSSIDGHNASDNETTMTMSFDNGRWYTVAVTVLADRIQAWIDDECVIEVERGDRRFSVYDQLLPTRPIGVFTWRTTGEVKEIGLSPSPLEGEGGVGGDR